MSAIAVPAHTFCFALPCVAWVSLCAKGVGRCAGDRTSAVIKLFFNQKEKFLLEIQVSAKAAVQLTVCESAAESIGWQLNSFVIKMGGEDGTQPVLHLTE